MEIFGFIVLGYVVLGIYGYILTYVRIVLWTWLQKKHNVKPCNKISWDQQSWQTNVTMSIINLIFWPRQLTHFMSDNFLHNDFYDPTLPMTPADYEYDLWDFLDAFRKVIPWTEKDSSEACTQRNRRWVDFDYYQIPEEKRRKVWLGIFKMNILLQPIHLFFRWIARVVAFVYLLILLIKVIFLGIRIILGAISVPLVKANGLITRSLNKLPKPKL